MRSIFAAIASILIVSAADASAHFFEPFLFSSASAAASYDAALLIVSAPRELSAGQASAITVTLKNIGGLTWQKTGAHAVSYYRYDPVKKLEMPSIFSTSDWLSSRRAALVPSDIKPGGTVNFAIPIRAPARVGTYHEDFILVAENISRMKHSQFSVDLHVTAKPPISVSVRNASSTAPEANGWSAELVDRGGYEWQIDAEDHVSVTVAFKNTGNKIWRRDAADFVSLYSVDGKKERKSLFYDTRWISKTQAVKLKEASVSPGSVGHFTFYLRAPRTPGAYQETFALASENTAWMAGGTVNLPIRVPLTSEFIATAAPEARGVLGSSQSTSSIQSPYHASLLLRSATAVSAPGATRAELTFGFKNLGPSWPSRSLHLASTSLASSLADLSWQGPSEPVRISGETKEGEIGFLSFQFKTPPKTGTYQAAFQLYVDDVPVEGGDVQIPVTVTADAPGVAIDQQGTTNNPPLETAPLNGDFSSLPNEPNIRVGLFKTLDDQMIVRASASSLSVMQKGVSLCRVNTGESVTVAFDRANKVYKVSGSTCASQSSDVFTIRSDDSSSPMEIADYSRPLSWLPGANDNTFRAQLELRYAPATDNVWVINELPVESYLKGIAETSNSSPQEYQRALLTAARTYAMYHVGRASKHANEFYTVDAHYDQVYRGYGAEARDPNVVAAVEATRGQIVTYNNALALTPYYSRSDGRTRAWTEVWGGGPYPWLPSVPVPWDQGKTLWGHGVGMSASGALGAANDGKHYDEILKYFYPGTELRKAYK